MDATTGSQQPRRFATTADRRYLPLVIVLLAAACGIAADRYCRTAFSFSAFAGWWACAAVWLTIWFFLWRTSVSVSTDRQSLRDFVAVIALLASFASVAAAWHDLRWQHFARHEIARYARSESAPVCIEAIACESARILPMPRETALRAIPVGERSRLNVRLTGIRNGVAWQPAAGNCQITVEGRLTVRTGDRLRVFGQFADMTPPRNRGEFNFAQYARGDRQLVRLTSTAADSMTVIEPASYWQPGGILDSVRRGGYRLIERCVGPDRAALASAILLGEREGLTREEAKSYLVTGTIHLLVVSGMNVAILAMGLHLAMRWGLVGRRTGLAIVMALVIAYALVAGAEPPIVRAALLAVAWCVAAWSGRRGLGFNVLAGAAIFVLFLNPADLFRAGPQLSFLAVATLIWMNEWKWQPRRPRGDRLDQMIAASRPWYRRAVVDAARWNGWLIFTTMVVWLTALPLVLSQFHVVTPVTILISPVVWLTVLVALWSGFLMLMVGWAWSAIGTTLGTICNASLTGLEAIVAWGESVPAGHFWAPGPAWWWLTAFYCGLIAIMIWPRLLGQLRWQVAAFCALVAIGFVSPVMRAATRDQLDVAFVSVGHGTCVVLQAPTGEILLYDAGSLGSPESAARTVASYLWHRGITRLDGIVISHSDVDHFNAVPGLLEQFRVGAIYVSPVMFDEIGLPGAGEATEQERADRPLPIRDAVRPANLLSGPAELRRAIDLARVPIREIWGGSRLQLGPEVVIDVLHPPRRGVIGNDNANSLTLVVEHDGQRVLLPGDLESPGLEDLMAELPRDCDVLLAPHHGSRRSDPPGFAAWSTPEWVVVSCGNVDVGLAVRSYELAGATTYQTNLDGTIEFSLGRQPLSFATWRARE